MEIGGWGTQRDQDLNFEGDGVPPQDIKNFHNFHKKSPNSIHISYRHKVAFSKCIV